MSIHDIMPLLTYSKRRKKKRNKDYDYEPTALEQFLEAKQIEALNDLFEKNKNKKDDHGHDHHKKKKWFEMDAQNLAAIIFLSTFLMVPVQMWMILNVLREIVRVAPR